MQPTLLLRASTGMLNQRKVKYAAWGESFDHHHSRMNDGGQVREFMVSLVEFASDYLALSIDGARDVVLLLQLASVRSTTSFPLIV